METIFEQSLDSGYTERTYKNASVDVTIAIAINFDSAGEKMTKKAVKEQNKIYIPIDANNSEISPERVEKIVGILNQLGKPNVKSEKWFEDIRFNNIQKKEIFESFWTSVNQGMYQKWLKIREKEIGKEKSYEECLLLRSVYCRHLKLAYPELDVVELDLNDGSTVLVNNIDFFKQHIPTLKRIMVGNHGVYLEMDEPENKGTYIKKRMQYYEYSRDGVKLYHQFKKVNYADYQIDKWYISPYEEFKNYNEFGNSYKIELNIAGNGLYTMRRALTQKQCDEFTIELLNKVVNHPNLKNKIKLIRSGGQTGFDEAGIKAGIKLNIPTLIYAPRGWRIKMLDGKDISDEQIFKNRFIND